MGALMKSFKTMQEIKTSELCTIILALESQVDNYNNQIKKCETIGGLENIIASYVYDINEIKTIINKLK
jgi:hypothetical protein